MAKPGTKRFTDSGSRRPTDSRALQSLSRKLRTRAKRKRDADRMVDLAVGRPTGADMSRAEIATVANSKKRQAQATMLVVSSRSLPSLVRAVARRPKPASSATRPPVLLPPESRYAAVTNFVNTMDNILDSRQSKKRKGSVSKTASSQKFINLPGGGIALAVPPPVKRKITGGGSSSRRSVSHRSR